MSVTRFVWFVSAAWCTLALSGRSQAQDEQVPMADSAAVSPDVWEQTNDKLMHDAIAGTQRSGENTLIEPKLIEPKQTSYYSPTLRGRFIAQWLFITNRGERVEFWGARVARLEPDSPLRRLGLHPGDVITRLDGIPIWRGMYRNPDVPWQIVEMEKHFGRTEVRYILRGSNRIRVGDIMLDGTIPDEVDDSNALRP